LVNKTPVGIKNKSLQLFDLQAFYFVIKTGGGGGIRIIFVFD